MKRIALLIIALVLAACAPFAEYSGVTRVLSTPTASLQGAAEPKAENGLAQIPLPVGYGVKGAWFELYFTDPSNPAADQLDGGPDGPLVDAIDSAKLSVDAAIYSLSLDSVRQALIRAHRRGVTVRAVMESDNMGEPDPRKVKEAGIPVVGDKQQGLMHNKFMVIDGAEVWTGSMNFTNSGAYSDRNNLMRIRSPQVAEDYEAEFNEMFEHDRFGPDVSDPTPHPSVTLDGTLLEIYFSPDDHVQTRLVKLVHDAESSISFLAYSFTADPLGEELRQRAAAGVTVSGVMDEGQTASNTGTEFDAFRLAGLDIRLDNEPGLMHEKVMVIDRQIVVMGSYNFTASAEKYNDENLIVIHSPELAGEYLRDFGRIYAIACPVSGPPTANCPRP